MALEHRLPKRTGGQKKSPGTTYAHHPEPLKGNRPPPGPHTAEAVARCLTQALRDAGRGPARIPQVYALLLVGWIRNYQARLDAVLDTLDQQDPPETHALRERWATALREVFDPTRLERPIELPELPDLPEPPDPGKAASAMLSEKYLEEFLTGLDQGKRRSLR